MRLAALLGLIFCVLSGTHVAAIGERYTYKYEYIFGDDDRYFPGPVFNGFMPGDSITGIVSFTANTNLSTTIQADFGLSNSLNPSDVSFIFTNRHSTFTSSDPLVRAGVSITTTASGLPDIWGISAQNNNDRIERDGLFLTNQRDDLFITPHPILRQSMGARDYPGGRPRGRTSATAQSRVNSPSNPISVWDFSDTSVIYDVPLPEVTLSVPKLKEVQFTSVFSPLTVTAEVFDIGARYGSFPHETFLFRANLSRARLHGRLTNPNNSATFLEGYSEAEAYLDVTPDQFGSDGTVFWTTPGFDVFFGSPGSSTFVNNTGSILKNYRLSEMGLSTSDSLEHILREAEAYIHTELSKELFGNFLVFEDPGTTELLITDPNGRQFGRASGTVIDDIPGYYDPSGPLIVIPYPVPGQYTARVTAIEDGPFILEAGSISGGSLVAHRSTGQVLESGSSAFLSIDYFTVPEPATWHLPLALIGFTLVRKNQQRRRQ